MKEIIGLILGGALVFGIPFGIGVKKYRDGKRETGRTVMLICLFLDGASMMMNLFGLYPATVALLYFLAVYFVSSLKTDERKADEASVKQILASRDEKAPDRSESDAMNRNAVIGILISLVIVALTVVLLVKTIS